MSRPKRRLSPEGQRPNATKGVDCHLHWTVADLKWPEERHAFLHSFRSLVLITRAKAARNVHAVIGVAKPSFSMDLTCAGAVQVCAKDQRVKQILHLKVKCPRKRGAVLNSSVGTLRLLQRTKERDEAYIIGSNQEGALCLQRSSRLYSACDEAF